MNGLTLVVMAAGIGSRCGGLKRIGPIGLNGEWIVDYSVHDALRCGFEQTVLVVRDEISAAFRERFDHALGARCETRYAVKPFDDRPPGPAARRVDDRGLLAEIVERGRYAAGRWSE